MRRLLALLFLIPSIALGQSAAQNLSLLAHSLLSGGIVPYTSGGLGSFSLIANDCVAVNSSANGFVSIGCGGSMTWPAAAGIVVYGGSSAWTTSVSTLAGLDSVLGVTLPSITGTPSTGHCVEWASAATLEDAGAACGSGGTGITQLTGDVTAGPGSGSTAATVVKVNGAVIPSSANCVGTNSSSQLTSGCAESVNAQTGTTYTILSSDCGKQVTFNNSSAIAVTVPQATSSFATCQVDITNIGAGTATLTPTTSTVNGASSLAVAQNAQCTLNSDGTNWQVIGCTALVSSSSSSQAIVSWQDSSGTGAAATRYMIPGNGGPSSAFFGIVPRNGTFTNLYYNQTGAATGSATVVTLYFGAIGSLAASSSITCTVAIAAHTCNSSSTQAVTAGQGWTIQVNNAGTNAAGPSSFGIQLN